MPCTTLTVATPTYTITFTVYDGSTGAKLSGASVYMDGTYKGSTGTDGKFVLSGISPGYHTFRFERSGYQTFTWGRDVQKDESVGIPMTKA